MYILFETEGVLTRQAMKTHCCFSFSVDQQLDSLHLEFSYSPKKVSNDEVQEVRKEYIELLDESVKESYAAIIEQCDLNNLISIMLEDPNGFRGNFHKHYLEQSIMVSQNEASDGFLPGDIHKGQWKVTLSNHAILSKELKYKLKVWGCSHGTVV